ncbi:MAG: hypothetical protein AAGA68_13265 [Pseudomonadota bacterium]
MASPYPPARPFQTFCSGLTIAAILLLGAALPDDTEAHDSQSTSVRTDRPVFLQHGGEGRFDGDQAFALDLKPPSSRTPQSRRRRPHPYVPGATFADHATR